MHVQQVRQNEMDCAKSQPTSAIPSMQEQQHEANVLASSDTPLVTDSQVRKLEYKA